MTYFALSYYNITYYYIKPQKLLSYKGILILYFYMIQEALMQIAFFVQLDIKNSKFGLKHVEQFAPAVNKN